jgi:hypothetical protein
MLFVFKAERTEQEEKAPDVWSFFLFYLGENLLKPSSNNKFNFWNIIIIDFAKGEENWRNISN